MTQPDINLEKPEVEIREVTEVLETGMQVGDKFTEWWNGTKWVRVPTIRRVVK